MPHRALARLSLSDVPALVSAFVWLVHAQLCLRFNGFAGAATVPLAGSARWPMTHGQAARCGWIVNALARRLPSRPNCLARSLALLRVVRRRGADATLRIGVRLEDGKVAAHAWVEWDGHVLNDTREVLARFSAFDGPVEPRKSWAWAR